MTIRTKASRACRAARVLSLVAAGAALSVLWTEAQVGPAPAGARKPKPRVAEAHWLTPFYREGQYRWLDIADRPYSTTFRRLSQYGNRQVLANYTQLEGDTLRGELVAHGLKPNFAYQVKLEGQPTKAGPFSAEDLRDPRNWTNKQLGELGRWWCPDCEYNVSSWSMDGDCHKGHRLLGYVLFDFFVTDENGSAKCTFSLDSSYHVLWKTSQYPPSDDDSAPRLFKPVASRSFGYSKDLPAEEVSIYLEHEYDRPRPGQARLPEGEYRCRLLLTEESFHSYSWGAGATPGGHWCHCLSDEELRFTVRR
ncbi:MAG: hypothetical protein COZ06_18885 [Armatimonadetes bacterium CG_4_10_14_3_um_filter_66_18]|nr:MAG: hypothetical protein AUJ96_19590 [Armatimonadetes bacterium CG2_30_66_41]PIU94781.1 MAG: hypothetical protein COS65_05875 [Armatimonadetes bacterium CG06_land_8_20_14_3_00_66_21]PIW13688.1 MAG: hypothetical protein COW34_08330 [Armatimonadetes bacterium CG17_big_fil_post_rev_8_21_14_2_50_66_6]PIX38669.1 MAG: hypothetical protein COZ57_30095 [Armatimonadetes bacterium CG_4_8_14_3_um_filter_66_20]PIY46072.1 MAG: hypothetical protein COZ06_18885 [Armatimonadetes bacterium CG_4_10_14_3_um_f